MPKAKVYFEWQQPKNFVHHKCKEVFKGSLKPDKFQIIMAVLIVAGLAATSYIRTLSSNKPLDPHWKLCCFFILGLLFLWFSGLVEVSFAYFARKVEVSEAGISDGIYIFKYEDIHSFQIKQEHFKGVNINVLEIKKFNEGHLMRVGIASEISIMELKSFLSERIEGTQTELKEGGNTQS